MCSILELGILDTLLRHLSEEEKNILKEAIKQFRSSTYGLRVDVDNDKIKISLYKGNDPAGLASAEVYNHCNNTLYFVEAKSIILYTIATANNLIQNYLHHELRDPEDYSNMEKYLLEVENCKNCRCLFSVFDDYYQNIFEKFRESLYNKL